MMAAPTDHVRVRCYSINKALGPLTSGRLMYCSLCSVSGTSRT